MIIYKIYIIPNSDMSASVIGVNYDNESKFFRILGCKSGPSFEYSKDENITTINLNQELFDIIPDEEFKERIKNTKQIKIKDHRTNPVSRIVDELSTIQFDINKDIFFKYFNLKEI